MKIPTPCRSNGIFFNERLDKLCICCLDELWGWPMLDGDGGSFIVDFNAHGWEYICEL